MAASQRREVISIGHRGQPEKDLAQMREGTFSVTLAGDDQAVYDRGSLASTAVTNEEPVLLSDGRMSDRVFDEVIVQPGDRVMLMRDEHIPVIE